MRRLLQLPITILGVTLLIFAMMQMLTPVERSALYVRDIPHTEGALDAIIRRYGLDDPFHDAVLALAGRPHRPRNGRSGGRHTARRLGLLSHRSPAGDRRDPTPSPASVELALWSMLPIIVIGVWLGIIAARNHNKLIDQVARVFALVGWSFPTFVFALLVLMIFYAKLGWFPPGRLSDWANIIVAVRRIYPLHPAEHGGRAAQRCAWTSSGTRCATWCCRLSPSATSSGRCCCGLTRSSMLESLRQDYMTTARSKGLPERTVVNRHALPNALIPVVTVGGLTVVGLISGVVIVETVFNYPGMGQAAASRGRQPWTW